MMNLHSVQLHMESHIAHVQEVVGEVLLDHIALVAAADHKIIDAVMAVNLQNVPKNWPSPDLHHRLGLQVRFLADPRAEPSC